MVITNQQIFDIAETLVANGEKPTIAKVRDKLGKGSFSTIGAGLKQWREEQTKKTVLSNIDFSGDATTQLQGLSAMVWQTAQEVAQQKFIAEREALQREREAAINETIQAKKQLLRLEEKCEDQSQQISNLLERLKDSSDTIERLLQTRKEEAA